MSSSGVVVGAQAWLAGLVPMSAVNTWKGDPRWIPSARFHFHSCQTWYSGLLRIVLIAHKCWYHPKHSNQARMEYNWTGCANSTCGGCRSAVISGRYNKCHSLQLQNHYAHFPPLQHTHSCKTKPCQTGHGKWSWVSRHCMLAITG